MGTGSNESLVREICQRLPCQVGGGVRSPERALELCAHGARKVIVGSALFQGGQVDTAMLVSTTAVPQVASGRMHALGVTSATRLASLPNVPDG